MKCNNLSNPIVTICANHDKFEKDFDVIVAYLSQYTNKRGKIFVAAVHQKRPQKHEKMTSNVPGTLSEILRQAIHSVIICLHDP